MSEGFGLPCYICEKPLVDPVTVQDERLASFIRKRYREFRTQYQLCGICYRTIASVFEGKYKRRVQLEIEKRAMTISSSYSTDEFDTLVAKTPLSNSLRHLVKHKLNNANVSSDKENDSSRSTNQPHSVHFELSDVSPSRTPSADSAPPKETSKRMAPPLAAPSKRAAVELDAPTTSTAAKGAADKFANVTKRRRIVEPTSGDSSFDDEPSILTSRGARLPHIQPAVASRTFVHPDKRVMDIYLAGTTGG